MESQIERCLISLRKIANLTSKSRICVWTGDIDVHEPTLINDACRCATHKREKMLDVLKSKYRESRDLVAMIIQCNCYGDKLADFRKALIISMEGLGLYKTNARYVSDLNIKSTVEHILSTEIPSQIKVIDDYTKYEEPQNVIDPQRSS